MGRFDFGQHLVGSRSRSKSSWALKLEVMVVVVVLVVWLCWLCGCVGINDSTFFVIRFMEKVKMISF